MQHGLPLVLAGLAVATVARADDLVASGDADRLVVERISEDKITAVYDEPAHAPDRTGALAWAWSDAKTLWVLRKHGDALSVARIVELRAEPPREITLADFRLKREPRPIAIPQGGLEPPLDGAIQPDLRVTSAGQVWLARCLAYIRPGECKLAYLRLDRPAPLANREPADMNPVEPELPSVPAPPGYSAALRTVKVRGFTFRGAECKGPHDEWLSHALYEVTPPENARGLDRKTLAEWATVEVLKADWVRAAPPVARYLVKKRSQTWAMYVEECREEHPAPVLLPDGRWIDRAIVRRADGSELGSLHGSTRVVVAPGRDH